MKAPDVVIPCSRPRNSIQIRVPKLDKLDKFNSGQLRIQDSSNGKSVTGRSGRYSMSPLRSRSREGEIQFMIKIKSSFPWRPRLPTTFGGCIYGHTHGYRLASHCGSKPGCNSFDATCAGFFLSCVFRSRVDVSSASRSDQSRRWTTSATLLLK